LQSRMLSNDKNAGFQSHANRVNDKDTCFKSRTTPFLPPTRKPSDQPFPLAIPRRRHMSENPPPVQLRSLHLIHDQALEGTL